MSNRNAPSFDLTMANQITRRLSGAASVPELPELAPDAPYVMFDASRFLGSTPPGHGSDEGSEAAPAQRQDKRFDRPEGSFDSWESLLGWCEEAFEAELCFVVDAQGFLLHYETHGNWPYTDIEDVASQLAVTISRADDARPTGRAQAMSIRYASYWTCCLRLEHEESEELMLVLLSDQPVPQAGLELLRDVFDISRDAL